MFERMLKHFEQRPMRERRECTLQNFISLLMVLIFFENFEKFSYGAFYHLSKMSLQGTIVSGRLRSIPGELNYNIIVAMKQQFESPVKLRYKCMFNEKTCI